MYKISYRVQGTATPLIVSSTLLQPSDRKQAAADNHYVQQRHALPPFGTAVISFDPDKVPLKCVRKPDLGNPQRVRLEVHIEKVA